MGKAETFECEIKLNDIHSRERKRFPTVRLLGLLLSDICKIIRKKISLRHFQIKVGRRRNPEIVALFCYARTPSNTIIPTVEIFFFPLPTAATKIDFLARLEERSSDKRDVEV